MTVMPYKQYCASEKNTPKNIMAYLYDENHSSRYSRHAQEYILDHPSDISWDSIVFNL